MNKRIGVICLVFGILALPSVGFPQQPIRWEPTLETAQRLAAQSNRLVLIQFWAPWCTVCKQMETEVFGQPNATKTINEKYIPVKINADHFPATARQYGITALPTTVMTTPDGKMVEKIRGRLETNAYVAELNRIAVAVEQQRAAANVPASPTGVAAAPGSEAPRTNPPPANRYTAAQPPAQPAPTAPTQPNAYTSRYGSGYAASQPPAQPEPAAPPQSNTQPSRYGPPANVNPPQNQPAPGYATQQPPQAPIGPAYGNQQPPAAPVQPQNRQPQPSNPPAGAMASQQPAPPTNTPAPAVNPPLCLDGYCPVSLFAEVPKWVPGNPQWGGIHRGRTYLFAGPEEQRRFFADPDRYAPVGSGNDIVLAAEQGRAVPGRREHGVFYGNRVYLFSSEESLKKFDARPDVYASQVLNANRSGANTGRQFQ